MENILENLPIRKKIKNMLNIPTIKCVTPEKIFLKAEDDADDNPSYDDSENHDCSPCCPPCGPCHPHTDTSRSYEDVCYPACSPCNPCYPCNPVEEFNEKYR